MMVYLATTILLVQASCNCIIYFPFLLPCWICFDFVPFSAHHPYFSMIGDKVEEVVDCVPSISTPQIFVERTLAIIKPEAINKALEIEEIIVRSGFTILQKRRVHMTPEQVSDFYAEHFGKLFFPNLVAYMSSGPVIVYALAREKAISYWREMLGPTNSIKARDTHPDSLRAIYGTDNQRNGVHGSDSYRSSEREIRFFFHDSITEPISVGEAAQDYLARAINPTLIKGLTELCKKKPFHPVTWLADWLLDNNPYKPNIKKNGLPVVEEPLY